MHVAVLAIALVLFFGRIILWEENLQLKIGHFSLLRLPIPTSYCVNSTVVLLYFSCVVINSKKNHKTGITGLLWSWNPTETGLFYTYFVFFINFYDTKISLHKHHEKIKICYLFFVFFRFPMQKLFEYETFDCYWLVSLDFQKTVKIPEKPIYFQFLHNYRL